MNYKTMNALQKVASRLRKVASPSGVQKLPNIRANEPLIDPTKAPEWPYRWRPGSNITIPAEAWFASSHLRNDVTKRVNEFRSLENNTPKAYKTDPYDPSYPDHLYSKVTGNDYRNLVFGKKYFPEPQWELTRKAATERFPDAPADDPEDAIKQYEKRFGKAL